jgi:hypothetical protein
MKAGFDSLGGRFIFLVKDSLNSKLINLQDYKGLPVNLSVIIDENMKTIKGIWRSGPQPDVIYPIIIYSDIEGNVLYKSSGYRIGIVRQILKHVKPL